MAKKASAPRKAAAKPAQSAKPRAPRPASPKSAPKRAAAKTRSAARSAKARTAGGASAKPSDKPARSQRRKNKTHDYVATLAAGARQLGLGLRRGAAVADPRKLIRGTSEKIRHIRFNRVADFCKKEWSALAALASRIDALANHPTEPPRKPRPKATASRT